MKITGIDTALVGNPWKNWLFIRVRTDEGIVGYGEGTLNGLSRTVEAAVRELWPQVEGLEVEQVELLRQRLTRDLYSDGGQVHMSALAAIEIACWDIIGKSVDRPVHALLGGQVRDRVRVYANGWYRVPRTPEAFAAAAADTVAKGYTALKFDPFGAAWRMLDPADERLAVEIVDAVRDAVGWDVDLLIEGHSRFTVASAVSIAERLAPSRPAWFEEPVPHHAIGATIQVARRSPIPIATGESLTSLPQIAELLAGGHVSILQPEPLYLGGVWATRAAASMADAHYAVVAPHSAQGPICTAVSTQLGACCPNFYMQELFDEFNDGWTQGLVLPSARQTEGFVAVSDAPGLGVEVDWDALSRHPYEPRNMLRLFESGWERRVATKGATGV